jgi:hypothetical protein
MKTWVMLGLVLSACGVPPVNEPGQRPAPPPAPAPPDLPGAFLSYAGESWLVWTVRDEYGDPRRRAVPWRTRYFRQRFGGERPSLAFEMRGTYARRVATVLRDGTLLLTYATHLIWAPPAGPSVEENPTVDGHPAHLVGASPHGVLLQPYDLNERRSVHFVPLAGGRLDNARRTRVTGTESLAVNSPPRFLIGEQQVAWQNSLFDLRSGRRRALACEPAATPTAMDDELLVVRDQHGSHIFRVADGVKVQTVPHPGGVLDGLILAVRHGIGYQLAEVGPQDPRRVDLEVRAVPLMKPGQPGVVLRRLPAAPGGRIRPHWYDFNDAPAALPTMTTPRGLVLWDGARFHVQPWLERLPPVR